MKAAVEFVRLFRAHDKEAQSFRSARLGYDTVDMSISKAIPNTHQLPVIEAGKGLDKQPQIPPKEGLCEDNSCLLRSNYRSVAASVTHPLH